MMFLHVWLGGVVNIIMLSRYMIWFAKNTLQEAIMNKLECSLWTLVQNSVDCELKHMPLIYVVYTPFTIFLLISGISYFHKITDSTGYSYSDIRREWGEWADQYNNPKSLFRARPLFFVRGPDNWKLGVHLSHVVFVGLVFSLFSIFIV